jgi:PKD repeat protein
VRLTGTHTYTAAGTYTVSVTVGNDSATTQLTLKATVEAPPVFHTTLAVSPADGVLAGESFSVKGDGYAAGETVKVVLHTAEEVTASVTAGADGTIASSLTVPDGTAPGLFSVTALGETSAMPATATLTVKPVVVAPVYAPHVRMSADSGRPGDKVTASGTGFAPGETVTVTFNSVPVVLGTPTADRLGALDFTFAIPAGAEVGEHTVDLVGSVSAVPVSLAFRVLPASTPGDGSTSANGPTEPSVVHRLGMTGLDVRPALLLGGLAIAAGLVLLLVRRRRQRSEDTAARD